MTSERIEGQHYPEILSLVSQELRRMGFEEAAPVEPFLSRFKNSYFSRVLWQGNPFFLKVLLKYTPERQEHFFREIELNRSLALLADRGVFTLAPRLVDSNTTHKPFWMLQEFKEGKSAEDFHPQEELSEEETTAIIDLLLDIQEVPIEPFLQLRGLSEVVKTYDFKGYLDAVNKYHEEVFPGAAEVYSDIHALFAKHRKLLDQSARYLAHGDFQPRNIILSDGHVFAVDWEHFSINTRAYDIAFFWMHLFSQPKWRRMLLQKFTERLPQDEQETFPDLFCLAIIRFATRKIVKNRLRGTYLPTEVEDVYRSNITQALESFETLMEA